MPQDPQPKVTIFLQPPNPALSPVEVEYLPDNSECVRLMVKGYTQVHPEQEQQQG